MPTRPHRPIDVLLVEDSAGDAELMTEALHSESALSVRVTVVEDGEEAIAYLRRQGKYADAPRPDLILMDLHMPRMGGLEALGVLKQHPEWRRIPVVIMTSATDEEHVRGAYSRHANCYVTKPLDLDEFIAAVRSIEDFWFGVARLPAA
jgi:chemotaxis family two-component system response regulator Rcp1